jgi:hypothetical protein
MRTPWHLRRHSSCPRHPSTPHPYVAFARQAAHELDDRAAARLDRGFVRSHPELLHTFIHVGERATPRRG